MKRLDYFIKPLYFLGIAMSLTIISGCQPQRQVERTPPQRDGQADMYTPPIGGGEETPATREDYALSEEGVEELDNRIGELNQELIILEEELKLSDGPLDEKVRLSWENIEEKREEVNNNIDKYNSAVQREDATEATEVRNEINKLLGQIEEEVDVLKDEFAIENQREQPIPN
jgi:hypothetical protein